MEDETQPVKEESVRVDVWAWSVRLFRTRAFAGAACKKEQLLVNGSRCKASRQVRIGDEIQVKRGVLMRTVLVKALLSKRIGAKVVDDYVTDLTPPEEYEKAAEAARLARTLQPVREAGTGRPTKRERRSLEEVMDDAAEDNANFEEFVKPFIRRR